MSINSSTGAVQAPSNLYNYLINKGSKLTDLALIHALSLPVWTLDPAGNLITCNTAYAALYGTTPDQIVTTQKILSARDGARLHLTTNGIRRLYGITLRPLPDQNGHIGTATDITTEETLAREHERTQSATKELLEQLSTAVAAFGADHKIEFFNSAFTRLWGLDEAWLLSHPKLGDILERLRDGRRLPEQVDFRRYKQSWLDMFVGLIDPFDDMMYLPDGTALRVLVVPNPAGGLIFTFEDVSSRLQLETSYNTLVAVQRETLDHLHEGIAVFGGDGRLKLWNPAFTRLWGLNPEDLISDPHISEIVDRMRHVFEPNAWDSARDHILSHVLNGEDIAGRLKFADGRLIAYGTTVLPDGGVLVSHTDITDSVRVETALRDKNAALEAAERLKLDFLANMSYQLRTPLNAIMGFIEILDHQYFGPLNDKQREYTSGTREASEKLLSLIDDILDLSTIEAGYMRLDYDQIDLKTFLTSVQGLTVEWARKEGLDVILDVEDTIGTLAVDPRRVKQALVNLIRNAIAFSNAGGVITLRARRVDTHIQIEVEDHGIGIPVADQTQILEPFARGSNTAARDGLMGQGGAGLGLTLVKHIAELHGGSVDIISQKDHGTTARLNLPIKK